MIVGVIKSNEDRIAYMAGDSPLFSRAKMIFGVSGNIRMGQLLRYEFETPRWNSGTKIEYLITEFVDEFKLFLKEADYYMRSGLGGDIMVAIEGELFMITNDFSVIKSRHDYCVSGTTDPVALGSLHTTGQLGLPPHERLLLALRAVETHTQMVTPPFEIISEYTFIPELLTESESE